jgi:hypothetical protein
MALTTTVIGFNSMAWLVHAYSKVVTSCVFLSINVISNSAKTVRVKHHPIWTWCGWIERLFIGDSRQISVLCDECQQCEKIDISAKDIDSRPLAAYNPVSDFR